MGWVSIAINKWMKARKTFEKKVILKQTCQVDHDHQYDPNQTIQIQWMLEI